MGLAVVAWIGLRLKRSLSRLTTVPCLIAAAIVLLMLQQLIYGSQRQLADQKCLEKELKLIGRSTAQLSWKLRDFRVMELNCLSLISGDAAELRKGLRLSADGDSLTSEHNYSRASCNHHLDRLVTSTLSNEEAEFPLAFSIMVYKDFDQVLRLLRAIYRPEHAYCLHVDSKASAQFRAAVTTFANCLKSNVIIANPSIDVAWSRYSVLEAELTCWQRLLSRHGKWNYLINLTGQEYPLRTMKELVGILKQLRGANNIENVGPIASYEPHLLPASQRMSHSDGKVVWHKGAVHVIVCRGFVQFVLGPVGMSLQEDLRRQDSERQREPPTDEVLFATINYNSGVLRVPGAPLDANLTTDNKHLPFFPRYKNWLSGLFGYPCLSGRIVRGICIWGLADLPAMNNRFELFANKFLADFQPLALRCLEERFWHNTMADYGLMGLNRTWNIDVTDYANYSFVHKHS